MISELITPILSITGLTFIELAFLVFLIVYILRG